MGARRNPFMAAVEGKKLIKRVADYFAAFKAPGANIYTHAIPTKAGILRLGGGGINDGSIMCRFDDPAAAARYVGKRRLNTCSGKWNFHFDAGVTADRAWAAFLAEFAAVQFDATTTTTEGQTP